jgi:hypothetical protein
MGLDLHHGLLYRKDRSFKNEQSPLIDEWPTAGNSILADTLKGDAGDMSSASFTLAQDNSIISFQVKDRI